MAKKKPKPAWRAKYDAANPTVTCRLPAEDKAFVDAERAKEGLSYADYIRTLIKERKSAQEEYARGLKEGRKKGYEKGYAEGLRAGRLQIRVERAVRCVGCGKLLDFDPSKIMDRARLGWQKPGECHHPEGQ